MAAEMPRRITDFERFEAKYEPEPMSGCWLWLAARDKHGYGVFSVRHRSILAHRFAYQHYGGVTEVPLELDHLCRVTSCVNPAHLESVTHAQNVLRGRGPDAARLRFSTMTRCSRGHLLSVDNTRYSKRRQYVIRQCRICIRAHKKRYREIAAATRRISREMVK